MFFTHLHIWYATKIAFKVISKKQAEKEAAAEAEPYKINKKSVEGNKGNKTTHTDTLALKERAQKTSKNKEEEPVQLLLLLLLPTNKNTQAHNHKYIHSWCKIICSACVRARLQLIKTKTHRRAGNNNTHTAHTGSPLWKLIKDYKVSVSGARF